MRNAKRLLSAATLGVLVLALSACKKEEGPAERAGKEIDKAISSTGNQLESIGKEIQNAVK